MSRNIKEIGKELMGKSLNSFHRKTGLTQLEENNKMQDGILDGILSQVDDAYIEKTEQSNVIHLEGSGDGVVVVDGIEGNTMVNEIIMPIKNIHQPANTTVIEEGDYLVINKSIEEKSNGNPAYVFNHKLKHNTKYTIITNVVENTFTDITNRLELVRSYNMGYGIVLPANTKGLIVRSFTTNFDNAQDNTEFWISLQSSSFEGSGKIKLTKPVILEGDWTNREIPQYFEGLQSSFEEKVNDDGKYEIEILSQNRNLLSKDSWLPKDATLVSETKDEIVTKGKGNVSGGIQFKLKNLKEGRYCFSISAKTHTQGDGTVRVYNWTKLEYINVQLLTLETTISRKSGFFTIPKNYEGDEIIIWLGKNTNYELETQFTFKKDFMLTKVSSDVILPYEEQKQNKIKLLLDEPLRKITSNIKDRLCIKDGKLVIERKCKQVKFDGTIEISSHRYDEDNQIQIIIVYSSSKISDKKNNSAYTINSTLPCITQPSYGMRTVPNFSGYVDSSAKFVGAIPNKTGRSFTNEDAKNYFKENPMDVVYELEQPIYEEVLNEYGEPIILEGYENGTIYIDSTIVPTTTVRYTPKMESFKTLKEVENNNIMLTNDVNDNIIPYMMDVDLMIMEKEMALMSQYKIRRIGAKDMTSMQKRTQDMLTRLIKGKTLTEQECKTRVVTYLDAGKITDAQADELMLLISEVYA